MTVSALPVISNTYDHHRETLHFAWRNIRFVFRGFWPVSRPKTQAPHRDEPRLEASPEITRDFRRIAPFAMAQNAIFVAEIEREKVAQKSS
jgi:hypothetical protein